MTNQLIKENERWKKFYQENKRLDEKFNSEYLTSEPQLYEKNCIELLVEIGEFINETKCFKYWSKKRPNKEKMLEELADCINMILYFYGLLDLEIDNFENIEIEENTLHQINELYILSSNLLTNLNKQDIINIFANILNLAYSLDLKEEEVLRKLEEKHQVIYERFEDENY